MSSIGSSSETMLRRTWKLNPHPCFLNRVLHSAARPSGPSHGPKVSMDVALPNLPFLSAAMISSLTVLQPFLGAFLPVISIVSLCYICPPNLHLSSSALHLKPVLQLHCMPLSNCHVKLNVTENPFTLTRKKKQTGKP